MRYGADYGMDLSRGGYGGGMNRGRTRGMGERGFRPEPYGGRGRGEPFRGRGGGYETFTRRDFLTNQGDFSDEFGGGRDYGYRGMDRNLDRDRWEGTSRGGYDYGFRGGSRDLGGRGRGSRFGREINYGPDFGNRRETTTGYDIAFRNFNR